MQNISETARFFARLKLLLSINYYHTRSRPVERNGKFPEFTLNLHLPKGANVETTAPERHIRTSIREQQHHRLTEFVSHQFQQLDRRHQPQIERRAASH